MYPTQAPNKERLFHPHSSSKGHSKAVRGRTGSFLYSILLVNPRKRGKNAAHKMHLRCELQEDRFSIPE